MRSQKLPVICLALFVLLFFIVGCGDSATSGSARTGSGGRNANNLVVDSTLTTIKIRADIPPMEVKHQTLIVVSLFPTGATGSVSDAPPVIKDATSIVTNATPLGTPGSTLVGAFGPNYTVVAKATLNVSPDLFSVASGSDITQTKPLDQSIVQWNWFITPQYEGQQYIGVDIEVQWKSTLTGRQGEFYTLGYPRFPVSVQALPEPTPTPTPKPDPVTTRIAVTNAVLPPLAAILSAIIGAIAVIGGGMLTLYFTQSRFRHWVDWRFKRKPKRK